MDLSPNLAPILPIIIVAATALVVLVVDLFSDDLRPHAVVSVVGLALASWFVWQGWAGGTADVYPFSFGGGEHGLVLVDDFGRFVWGILLITGFATVLLSANYLDTRGMGRGEYYILLLAATAGMMLLATANELVLLFLALETFSLGLYVLSGFRSGDRSSQEAALKYFVLGSFGAAFLLYGTALVYATYGTTSLTALGALLTEQAAQAAAVAGEAGAAAADAAGATDATEAVGTLAGFANQLSSIPTMAAVGLGLILVALGFKIAVVPFHQWTPDVYTGAPTPVTAFMAAGTKAAAFAALIRVLWIGFPAVQSLWLPLLAFLAILSMLVGNLIALVQSDLKRMLAYSAIAHAGYVLVAVVAGPPDGGMAALYYLLAYAVMNLGAFGVLIALGPRDVESMEPSVTDASDLGTRWRDATRLEDIRGLAGEHPGLAAALAIFLLSLTGLPPTIGFIGKWYIFRAAVAADQVVLAVIVVMASVLSAFYYLRPVLYMYMPDRVGEADAGKPGAATHSTTTPSTTAASPAHAGDAEGMPSTRPSPSRLEVATPEAIVVAVAALVVAGAVVLSIPFARGAETAAVPGHRPSLGAQAPENGIPLFFSPPEFNKDAP